MADIQNPRWLYAKAGLLLFLGLFAGVLLLIEAPSLRVAAFYLISIWAFCRAYYFAFYVVQHYIDPRFRFAGLWDFAQYALGWRRPESFEAKPIPERNVEP